MELPNNFAELVRGIFTRQPELRLLKEVVIHVATESYVTMHPTSDLVVEDVTQSVKDEAPHLHIPDTVSFYMRRLYVSAEPIIEVYEGVKALGIGDDEFDEMTRGLLEAIAENGGRYMIHASMTTAAGMNFERLGWSPTQAELAVLDDALSRVSERCTSEFGGDFYEFSGASDRGPLRRMAKHAVDDLVEAAAAILDDTEQVGSAIDAWASEYREGR